MKKGFTLAELIITLGIIGIVSAITLPLAWNARPDRAKATYLQVRSEIKTAIKTLAKDTNRYRIMYNNSGTNYDLTDFPFFYQDSTQNNDSSRNTRMCQNLALAFGQADNNSCPNTETWSNSINGNPHFSKNGIDFWIYTNNNIATPNYRTDIYFDINQINGDRGNVNCLYNARTCPNPDRFRLSVNAKGEVFETDAMGVAYLSNQRKWSRTNYNMTEHVSTMNNNNNINTNYNNNGDHIPTF